MRVGWSSVLGLSLGCGLLFAAHAFDGGRAAAIFQPAAAVIVFGGTCAALLLGGTPGDLARALRLLPRAFADPPARHVQLTGRLVALAGLARKLGLMSLDEHSQKETDPFLRAGLRHLVDGASREALRDLLESDVRARSERDFAGADIYETAGGVAPTLGVLGAVLGLIQVMQHLDDPGALGSGVANAFVATLYGVALANLVLLPIAAKLRRRIEEQRQVERMVVEGVLGIQDGLAPQALEERLAAFVGETASRARRTR